jgi:hypothetical protein
MRSGGKGDAIPLIKFFEMPRPVGGVIHFYGIDPDLHLYRPVQFFDPVYPGQKTLVFGVLIKVIVIHFQLKGCMAAKITRRLTSGRTEQFHSIIT